MMADGLMGIDSSDPMPDFGSTYSESSGAWQDTPAPYSSSNTSIIDGVQATLAMFRSSGGGISEDGIIYAPDGSISKDNYFVGTDSDPAMKSGGVDVFRGLFDFIKNKDNAHITKLGADFIAGMFGQKYKQGALDAQKKMADAAMLRAQTDADAQARKVANSSAIGKTNFGTAMGGTGLMFSDQLAKRHERAGAY